MQLYRGGTRVCDGHVLRPDGNVLCQLPACDIGP